MMVAMHKLIKSPCGNEIMHALILIKPHYILETSELFNLSP